MKKKACLTIVFTILFINILPLKAMAHESQGEPSLDLSIALAAQAASTHGTTRMQILNVFSHHGMDLSEEKTKNPEAYNRLIQLGAIFLGAARGSNMVKTKLLNKYEKMSYYLPFFERYPGLLDALIDLGNIIGYMKLKKGKLE